MSGNAKQRRKARRAAVRTGTAPATIAAAAAPDLSQRSSPYLTVDEIIAFAPPHPSRWWLAAGIIATVVIFGAFIAWVCTLPVRP